MITRQARRKRRLIEAGAGLILALLVAGLLSIWLGLAVLGVVIWRAARYVGVPVMVYHSISDNVGWLPWADNIAVRPAVFARHMAHLARSGWTVISSETLIAAQQGHVTVPRRSVVLQFDDAYLDFFTEALPVLTCFQLPATVFASSDFIDPSSGLRQEDIGYMNADELRQADANPLIDIACHGKDHARIATGPETSPRKPDQWGKETAWLWSLCPGNKARWFETTPPAISEVPENDSSLCARAWSPDGLESTQARDARVTAALQEARAAIGDVLGRETSFLCWPFDRCDPAAIANAQAAGFTALTGGVADNSAAPQPGAALRPMSRTHVNDHAAGGGGLWVEVLVFRAKLEVAAGNLLWWPVTSLASLLRKRRYAFLHGPAAASKSHSRPNSQTQTQPEKVSA